MFNVDRFELATKDKFFLCIEAIDPKFDKEKTKAFLETLRPDYITVVDHVYTKDPYHHDDDY